MLTFIFALLTMLPNFADSLTVDDGNGSHGYQHPHWSKTPGVVCTKKDANFSRLQYKEQIARCNRVVTLQTKKAIAKEYGNIPKAKWDNYEFDHLLPLCAGGSDDIRNLWAQPIKEAHEKDKVEDEVCAAMKKGTMTQKQAVAKIMDWFK